MDIIEHVKKAKDGDKEALLELILAKKDEYYKLSYVYMKNESDALDAMQDMIVILYEKIKSLKSDDSFYSWSKTILVNCCKRDLRKKKKIIPFESILNDNLKDDIEDRYDSLIIEQILNRLDDKHRDVIKLRYYLDYDYETISQILKIPTGTVKSRISIGLNKMRQYLGGEYNEGYRRNVKK